MLRNIIGRIFNAKNCVFFFFSFFSFIFFEKSHSPCRKKKIFEKQKQKKKKKTNNMDGFSTQKRAIFGRIFNSTAYIYIYLSIYFFLSIPLSFYFPTLLISFLFPFVFSVFCIFLVCLFLCCLCSSRFVVFCSVCFLFILSACEGSYLRFHFQPLLPLPVLFHQQLTQSLLSLVVKSFIVYTTQRLPWKVENRSVNGSYSGLSGSTGASFQSRYTIAIVYRLRFFMYHKLSRYMPPRPP